MEVSHGRHLWSAPREARSVEAGRPPAWFQQVATPPDPGAGWARKAVAYTCECALRGCHQISGNLSPGRAAAEPPDPCWAATLGHRAHRPAPEAAVGHERPRLFPRPALRLAERGRAPTDRSR